MGMFKTAAILLAALHGIDALVPPNPSRAFVTQSRTSSLRIAPTTDTVANASQEESDADPRRTLPASGPPFKNIMAANRAEIAVRIMRAATELNAGTVAIYCHEDRYSQHRWGADRSYLLAPKGEGATPISTYLDIAQIIKIAKEANVDAIHPGYGFLSESPEFAASCADAGITFVGPTVDNLNTFADKTSARAAAIEAGVPVVPGSDGALRSAEEVTEFVESIGLPVILKVRFSKHPSRCHSLYMNLMC